MKKEFIHLMDAVRQLGIKFAPRVSNPHGIRIAGKRVEFPEKLYQVALMLDAADKASATALEKDNKEDGAMDPIKLRTAIDGLFRWMRSNGQDVEIPRSIVANILGMKVKAQTLKYTPPTPKPKPKNPGKMKPLTKLIPGPGEEISLEALHQKAYQIQLLENSMGHVLPRRG